jgi:hypothetical protein
MKARLYYFNNKTHRQDERAFDRLYRDLDCVSRSNDPSKLLADNALRILSNLVPMLLASKNKIICINQDFLSNITGKESDQNSNLLKQLKDIISYKYHRMACFEGKRYNYCYIIQFSEDGEKRASNPELFYTIDSKINLVRKGKKFGLIAEKIRASYIDKIREIKKEKEEEPKGYSSSFSKKEEINKKKKDFFHSAEILQITNNNTEQAPQKITEVPTLANGYPTEPAKVYQKEDRRVVASEVVTNCHLLEDQQPRESRQLEAQSLAEEREHYRFHRQRESSDGLSLLRNNPLLARLLNRSDENMKIKTKDPIRDDLLQDALEIMIGITCPLPCDMSSELKKEEVTQMKERQMPLEPKRNMEFELSAAIFKSFGGARSDEIMDHCKFIPINENKIGVQLSNGFSLPQADREQLKTCIRSVYGDTVNIVSSAVLKIAPPKPKILVKPQIQQYFHKWTKFRNDLLNYLPEKTGHHSLNTWFDKLRVSEDQINNRIILTGSRFYVDSVYNRYQTAIEHVVKKNKVTLELHFENGEEKPIIYKPKGGIK